MTAMLPPIVSAGLLASAMTDPDKGSSGGTLVLVAAAIVAIAALCLYLLFRRGSIADRARTDMPDPDEEPDADEEPGPGREPGPDPDDEVSS